MSAAAKDKKSNMLISSLRRNVVRIVPPSVLEEMRPILSGRSAAPVSGTGSAGGTTAPIRHHNTQRPGSSQHRTVENFEISLRDHSDATAKRGFRVQVPKRLIFYTILVFVVVPVFLFLYLELHKKHPTVPQKLPEHKDDPDAYDVVFEWPEDGEDGVYGAQSSSVQGNTTATTSKTSGKDNTTKIAGYNLGDDETEAGGGSPLQPAEEDADSRDDTVELPDEKETATATDDSMEKTDQGKKANQGTGHLRTGSNNHNN